MDYEKKYKEALERARDYKNNIVHKELTVGESIMDYIFPELKESEDERIRQLLIRFVAYDMCDNYSDDFTPADCVAWLEKQGEQKPANTVEQKCEESKTKVFDAPTPFEDKLYAFVLACEILVDPSKREFILEHSQEILDAAREQIGKEQKPAWSIKEKLMLNDIIETTERSNIFKENYQRELIDWLKSLKTRYTWKPSDEQLEALKNAIHIKPFKNPSDSILWRLYEQLKKLKS